MNDDTPSPVAPAKRAFRRSGFWGWVLGATVCGWTAGGLRGADPAASGGPLFHEAAYQFRTMTTTLYQHGTQVDRASGSYRYDCVGFVSYALKQAAPKAREAAFKACGIAKGRIPSPPKYRAFLAGLAEMPQPGWTAVVKAADLRPGDVVAWEKKSATSTGHAVVIGSAPAPGPDGTWLVKVFDSTASPHGDDSRPNDGRAGVLASTGRRSGLGHGMMAFAADPASGALIGYRWSPKSKTAMVPIAAGRPTS